jgi:hypothetical protein
MPQQRALVSEQEGNPVAIRGGSIIHVGNNAVLLSRLQTAGPGTVNVKRTTVYETGNYLSVGQVSDIPDLSFTLESFDASCAMEALLLDQPVGTTHSFDLSKAQVLNVKSAFKPGANAATPPGPFNTVGSACVPALHLESVAYKFGVGTTDASQTATLKGDTLYYNPGSTYVQSATGTNSIGQTVVTAHAAYGIVEGGVSRRILAVTAGELRLQYGTDYTESYGTITSGAAVTTLTTTVKVPTTETIYVTYSSPDIEAFPQSVHALVSGVSGTLTSAATAAASSISTSFAPGVGDSLILDDTVGSVVTEVVTAATVTGTASPYTVATVAPLAHSHDSGAPVAQYVPTVRPAALRGRDIDVYIGPAHPLGTDPATAIGTRRHGLQTANVDWKVTLTNDEEFGNYHYVNIDYDVPVVSGSVAFRPQTYDELLKMVQDFTVTDTALHSASPYNEGPLDVQVVLKNPIDGHVLKRLHIPDARFSLPGYSAKVQQKLDLTANFQSDTGAFMVYDA